MLDWSQVERLWEHYAEFPHVDVIARNIAIGIGTMGKPKESSNASSDAGPSEFKNAKPGRKRDPPKVRSNEEMASQAAMLLSMFPGGLIRPE